MMTKGVFNKVVQKEVVVEESIISKIHNLKVGN